MQLPAARVLPTLTYYLLSLGSVTCDVSVWFGRLSMSMCQAPYMKSLLPRRLRSCHLPSFPFSIYLVYMAHISELSMFESLFQSASEEYERQTGINLVGHPLAVQLEHCNSVESIAELLHDQARNFRQFRGNDNKLMTSLKHTVRTLHMLSGTVTPGGAFGFVCRNG